MALTAKNIGPAVYRLFHRVSQGLQGKGGKTLEEELAEAEESIRMRQEWLKKGGEIIDGTVYPFRERGRTPGGWSESGREICQRELEERKAYKQEILAGGEELLAREQREFYLNPRDCVQTGDPLDLMLCCPCEENMFGGRSGIYALRPILLSTEDVREYFEHQGIPFPPLKGYGPEDEKDFVFILREIDEPQIHFYGTREGRVPEQYRKGFRPLGRRNLGQELAYCFDEFVEQNPRGIDGRNTGPQNVPYMISGRGGLYTIRLLIPGQPVMVPAIFTHITLDDMKQLRQDE